MRVIYGAQGIALGAYKAIKNIFPMEEIECFLVTTMGRNASTLAGIPVRELENFAKGLSKKDKESIDVLICTPASMMEAIENSLEKAGLYKHVRLTSVRWAEMMKNAFVKTGEYMPLTAYLVGSIKANVTVYKMKHVLDKVLQTECIEPGYVRTVQVGTSITEKKQVQFYDNDGENISDKNKNFCELTGLYWVWRNQIIKDDDENAYYGIAHYRRILQLTEDDLFRLRSNNIDVVLPYPMPYASDIESHHKRYLTDKEWNSVLQALKELQPEYLKAWETISKQEYFYNYNIILAKKDVLREYCEWLFPILFRVEELNSPECIEKPNRFIGYIAETLETLYFMYNNQKYRIAHTGCLFLT